MPNLGIEVGNIWGLNDVLSNDFMGFHGISYGNNYE